jgi:O-succinylbenzoic acid--CoA ligase
VERGDVVETTLPPGLPFAELLHALPRLGAALAPLAPAEPGRPRLPAEEAERSLRTEVDPEETHTVIHTSGTTGEPRAVALSYANHVASAAASAGALGVEAGDRWLCPLPLHHVGGLNVLVRCVINRTTAVLHRRFDAGRVRGVLERGEVTLASMVPTMLARLRDAGLGRTPEAVRAIVLGGGPIPASLLEWAAHAGVPAVPVYGMTETCSQVVAGSPGTPMAGVSLRVAADGEILVRGPMVARGELAGDGWLHTGDRGRLDGDGRLRVDGRIKELIVSGGENVAPLEVEQVLMTHPAVADAGVAGVPDAEWGEAVTAFVVLRAPAAPHELTRWCRVRLEPFKVPKAVHVVDELPRNTGGKLLRDRLVEKARRGARGGWAL